MSHHGPVELTAEQIQIGKSTLWAKLPMLGSIAAVVGFGGAWAAMGGEEWALKKFWTSYLTAFMFTLALGLGGLLFVVLQHLVRAGWSVVVRRLAEHVMFTLPFVALMGLPIVLVGSHEVFEWTHVDVVAADPMLQAKSAYLNEGAFRFRFGIYLVLWAWLALRFWSWSMVQDKASDPAAIAHKQRWLAPIATAVYAMTMTFGAFDFMMSLDPHWFSTIFGVYYFAGMAGAIHSLLVILVVLMHRSGHLRGVVTVEHFHDLGKFMFGFTVFWTYIGFSQYFLIWYANIPEETEWFSYRGHGQWLALSLVVVFGRFVLPWFALLRRGVKRNPAILVWIALFILCMEYVDMYWLVQPPFAHHLSHELAVQGDVAGAEYFANNIAFGATDVLCLVGFMGVFFATFGWSLARRALVPVGDPRLQESLKHENF